MRFRFLSKILTKEALLTWMGINLFLLVIRYTGLLFPLESAFYDLLFFLRPIEERDERIVLVTWDEDNIQEWREGTISDEKLVKVLQAIKAQKPSVIGLDLYRDVPVASFELSRSENQKAYRQLSEIFSSTKNLIGIAKVVPPLIDPPETLARIKERIGAADLLTDEDNTIRQAYFYPRIDKKGNLIKNPTLALYIAVEYLQDRGFEVEMSSDDRQLIFFQNDSQLKIDPSSRFDGGYTRKNTTGFSILVNWRKQNSSFRKVGVAEIIQGEISKNIFKDKIVLIGNTSVSGADKHHLPIDRWNDTLTNGVEVHAQIASSIISAALDKRPLINAVPEWSEILLLFVSGGSVILAIERSRHSSPLRLFFIGSRTGTIAISFSIAIALIGFANGYWIPIAPGLISSAMTPGIFCLIVYINNIKQNNEDFRQLIKNLNHSLRNHLNSVRDNSSTALSISRGLVEIDIEEIAEEWYEYEQRNRQTPLESINKNLEKIANLTFTLSEEIQEIEEYIKLTCFEKAIYSQEPTNFNEFISQTVQNTIKVKNKQCDLLISLEEEYDSSINSVLLDRKGFFTIVQDLIDNAYYAIKEKAIDCPSLQGCIKITTKKNKNKLLFSIEDNGKGIESKNLDRLFQPFFSTKSANKGQGLGLFLARETIVRYEGQIVVESVFGEGSIFTISFPKKIQI